MTGAGAASRAPDVRINRNIAGPPAWREKNQP
jgi:hypothetical protein